MFEIQSQEAWQVEEGLVSTSEHMQTPNETGPGVQRSKRHPLPGHTHAECFNTNKKG